MKKAVYTLADVPGIMDAVKSFDIRQLAAFLDCAGIDRVCIYWPAPRMYSYIEDVILSRALA